MFPEPPRRSRGLLQEVGSAQLKSEEDCGLACYRRLSWKIVPGFNGQFCQQRPPTAPSPALEAMPYHRVLCLILLTLCGVLVPAALAEYSQGSVPTLWNDPPELPSGAGPFDAATTPARLSDATAFAPYTPEPEPEDTTRLHRLDAGDGSLGPGAIGAIVIASLLGTSVLVALVVITLRKFSAS
ncbi:protein SNORC isoform X2 [Phaenicophaeus curvirostris]|uniref:protein SNORC isoform X2 n=1 Tax=Phaenicophaeus curvirostris TaxID=33595 RepID=UPI0037F0E7CE